jgi:hypothetical protein
MEYQVSHPHKTTGKITFFYVLWQQIGRQKFLNCLVTGDPQVEPVLNFFMSVIFISFVGLVLKYLNIATLPNNILTVFIVTCSYILFMVHEHIPSFLCIYF